MKFVQNLLIIPAFVCICCADSEVEPAPTPKPTPTPTPTPTPEPEPVVTELIHLNVHDSYNTSKTDNWVIIHNSNGDVLEFKTFEANDNTSITTTKEMISDTIAVTLLSYTPGSDSKNYSATTYTDILTGHTLNLRKTIVPVLTPPTTVSPFKVAVTGINGLDQFTCTSKFASSCAGSATNSSMQLDCSLSNNEPKRLLQISSSDEIRYKIFDIANLSPSYNISFKEMLPFDKVFEFKFPSSSNVYLLVSGKEPEQPDNEPGYLLNLHFNSDSHSVIRAGYLDFLVNYATVFRASYAGYALTYSSQSAIPEGIINWPDPADFEIKSKGISNFSAVTNADYKFRISHWLYNEPPNSPLCRVQWAVWGANATHALGSLPDEILSAHPALIYDGLKYSETRFFTQAESYEAAISKAFGENTEPESERIGISRW